MTTTATITQTCAVCGHDSEHFIVLTSNSDAMDLDGRLRGKVEITRYGWPRRCPACGYCFFNLELAPPGGDAFIRSVEYQAIVDNESVPETVRLWLGTARVLRAMDDRTGEADCLVNSAWVCDDAGLTALAAQLRRRATDLYRRLLDAGSVPEESRCSAWLRVADLQRRIGLFADADQALAEAHRYPCDREPLPESLKLERRAIDHRDMSARRVPHITVVM